MLVYLLISTILSKCIFYFNPTGLLVECDPETTVDDFYLIKNNIDNYYYLFEQLNETQTPTPCAEPEVEPFETEEYYSFIPVETEIQSEDCEEITEDYEVEETSTVTSESIVEQSTIFTVTSQS